MFWLLTVALLATAVFQIQNDGFAEASCCGCCCGCCKCCCCPQPPIIIQPPPAIHRICSVPCCCCRQCCCCCGGGGGGRRRKRSTLPGSPNKNDISCGCGGGRTLELNCSCATQMKNKRELKGCELPSQVFGEKAAATLMMPINANANGNNSTIPLLFLSELPIKNETSHHRGMRGPQNMLH